MNIQQKVLIEKFRSLHVPGRPIVLANAGDAASAVVLERLGFEAVATTSGGLAWATGFPDGNQISTEELLAAVDRIRAVVAVPVSVDIEGGLSAEPEELAVLVRELTTRDIAGFNVEDSWDGALLPLEAQQERIAAARVAAGDLFLNARIDTFFFGTGDDKARLGETIMRASALVEVGADGVFVPGLSDLVLIRELVARVTVPVNIMTGPGGPTVAQLADAGVARVSLGTALAEAAYARANDLASQFRTGGAIPTAEESLSYSELNELLQR